MKNFLFICAIGVLALCSCTQPQHDLLITDVNIIDVITGEILSKRTVGIDGDEITAIYSKSIKPGKETEVVEGKGKFLMPGLWDMHAHYHWYAKDFDLLMIPNGVLGVRDPWGDVAQTNRLREEHKLGTHKGVDIFTAGTIIDGSPSMWTSAEVGSPEEARAIVNCQVQQGVDFVKTYSLLEKDVYLALMDEARKLGVHASGHVPDAVSMEEAVAAGHRIDDHNIGLRALYLSDSHMDSLNAFYEAGEWNKALTFYIDNHDRDLGKQRLNAIKDQDIWFCPTFVTYYGVFKLFQEKMMSDHRNKYIPIQIRHHGARGDFWENNSFYLSTQPDSIIFESQKKITNITEDQIKDLIEAGAKVLAGTDYIIPYIYPGFSIHEEMQIFSRLGMTPLQALQTATINPARAMQNEMVGEIKIGKRANLVLLNSNPLDDIQNTEEIEAVILRGEYIDRSSLDEMLRQAKQMAKGKPLYEWFKNEMEAHGINSTMEKFLLTQDEVDKEYPVRWVMLRHAFNNFMGEGKREEAIAIANLIYDLFPDWVWSLAFTGRGLANNGEEKLARKFYHKSLEVNPCYNIVERWLKELDVQEVE